MTKDLTNVVAAHIADLRRCLADLHSYGMTATAIEFAKAANELEAALTAQPAAPAVVLGGELNMVETHPNYVAGFKAGHAAGKLRAPAVVEGWERLYRRMRNVAAGYSNHCDENGSTRRLEKELTAIEADARSTPPKGAQP